METAGRPSSEIAGEVLLESRLGVRFKNLDLLRLALVHRSYAFEHGAIPHNERLEFLGDAVLGLVVTHAIFMWYPNLTEGEMAKLRANTVNMGVLADVARKLDIGEVLLLGRGEDLSGGRDKSSILADTLEAVIGAVYLDCGREEAERLVIAWFTDHIRDHVERGVVQDFKTNLQEHAAKSGLLPDYRVTSTGPDHAKRFTAEVLIGGERMGSGEGRSKKEAEQAAAKSALDTIASRPLDPMGKA